MAITYQDGIGGFNPAHLYGDFVTLSGHGWRDDDPIIEEAREAHKDQRKRFKIPEDIPFNEEKLERWMVCVGEDKGKTFPHKIEGVPMGEVTFFIWKTIPEK